MKKIKLYLTFLMIFSLNGMFSAQTVDGILAKNIERRGGREKLAAIKTLKYTGSFKQPGFAADLTLFFESPNKIYFDLHIGDSEAKIGYDGRTLWKQPPGRSPVQSPKKSDTLVAVFAEFHEFLFALRETGYEFECAGEDIFDGAETYKIKVKPEDGHMIDLFIDKTDDVVRGVLFDNPEGSQDALYFRDYRETDGLLLPHSIEARKGNGEITNLAFEKIESNVEIDKKLFSLPITSSYKKNQFQEKDIGPLEYSYRIPEQVDDGWITASLPDVGMETEPLIELMKILLNRNDHFIHSFLIIKNGKLVFEEYFDGSDLVVSQETMKGLVSSSGDLVTKEKEFDRETLHFQASVTKSFTSLLFGIACDRNLIRGIDEKMFSYFPEYSMLNSGEKKDITIKHMLSMSTGIPWSEASPYTDSRNYIYQLLAAEDPLKYVLQLNLFASPGKAFNYNSGTTVLLGEIIRRTSKMDLEDFAENFLFNPLGITKFEMVNLNNAKEVFFASSGLYLRPRDMAKIGQLYLQEGMWENKRIVSAEWIRESVKKSTLLPSAHSLQYFAEGYGHQWWLGTFYTKNTKAYMAAGFGGQFIVVLPEIKVVVVLTGGDWDNISPIISYDLVIDNFLLSALL